MTEPKANEDACSDCAYSWDVYGRGGGVRLAVDFDRHAALYQCGACGRLYEVFPEERALPEELELRAARERFPGAI